MKKLVLILLTSIFLMAESTSFFEKNANTFSEEMTQEDINRAFDELGKIDPSIENLQKALYFEYGDKEKGIDPDILKAVKFYFDSFEAKNDPISGMKLGLYSWAVFYDQKGLDGKALVLRDNLRDFFKEKNKTPDEYFSKCFFGNFNFINSSDSSDDKPITRFVKKCGILAGIFLTKMGDYDQAIKILTNIKLQDDPSSQIWTAFAYKAQGILDLANLFLDNACKNKKANKNIKAFCSNTNFITIQK